MSMFLSILLISTVAVCVTAIVVHPGGVVDDGNCTGQIDAYLCNCLASNTNVTIDIQLSVGNHTLTGQPLCILYGMTSITINGTSSNETIVNCVNGFNVRFLGVQNVVIHNLVMNGCGDIMFDSDQTQQGSYVFYFDRVTNVNISNLYMSNTIGYGIVIIGTMANVELSDVHIINTVVASNCMGYNYDNSTADFSCSGSGILIAYAGKQTQHNMTTVSSILNINNCLFVNNNNILPATKYNEFLGVTNTGYKGNNPIPLVGAACITLFYGQETYNISTVISNTQFYNNSGTFSGSVAILYVDSTRTKIIIENCTFYNNKGTYQSASNDGALTIGGIYFINLGLLKPASQNALGIKAEVLTISKCNFLHSSGKLGAAIHLEKNSPDPILVVIKIKHCNFTKNEADSGSVIFATDRSSPLSYRETLGGSLSIHLTNVNADYNILSPSSTIDNITNAYITGIFHISNCLALLTCDKHCRFQHNQPSVFYGHESALIMNGSVLFMNNTARYGGAIRLLNTVIYIHTNSSVHFMNNYASANGGAIKVEFAVTNIQSQDNCPFQFIGLPLNEVITDDNFKEIKEIMNINVSFQSNYARGNDLESIFASVFYVCSWYPDTSVQTQIGPNSEVTESGFRNAVYREAFNYIGDSIHNHLNISAIIPCVCDNGYNLSRNAATDCLENLPIYLSHKVIPGRSFVINVTSLDTVGSIGYSSELVSTAYNMTSGEKFKLNEDQVTRAFSVGSKSCVSVDFTIYVHTDSEELLSATNGSLTLLIAIPRFITIPFNFVEKCPTGFILGGNPGRYACVCDVFLTKVSSEGFLCDQNSGLIRRIREISWLAAIDDDVQYVELCSPTLCDHNLKNVSLNLSATSNIDILCTNDHAGRACGDCKDGYSRVFGSDSCEKCNNVWLITILLYAVLGVILIVILFLLKFTVTLGIINGLIFFCNMMSINEKLFFNENISRFSFLRVFISIFNLDLGFEICFYDGMSQIVKTGLQFVFPVYLWPLMIVIVYLSRWSNRFQRRVSRTSVPVFATLILLSYVKLLRTAISVFSFVDIKSSMKGTLRAWRPDPSVGYLEGGHIVLFVIAVLFSLFIFPFAVSFTYPKILHYKKFGYLFPLFDSFVAPYKDKYRFWFGVRAVILIYLAIMETIIFTDIEALLLSSITVVGAFTVLQAYIRPFKNASANALDLMFTSTFLLISSIVLYLNPTSNGYKQSDIVVYSLGYAAFILFCIVVVYHIHHASKTSKRYITTLEWFWKKVDKHKENKLINIFFSTSVIHKHATLDRYHVMEDVDVPQHDQFQESLLNN